MSCYERFEALKGVYVAKAFSVTTLLVECRCVLTYLFIHSFIHAFVYFYATVLYGILDTLMR